MFAQPCRSDCAHASAATRVAGERRARLSRVISISFAFGRDVGPVGRSPANEDPRRDDARGRGDAHGDPEDKEGRRAKKAKTRTATKLLGKAGRHKVKLKKLKRGTAYKLTLTVASADGQEASDTAKLKVQKKKQR